MATMTTTAEIHTCYTSTTTNVSHAPTAMDELHIRYSSSMTNASNTLRKKSRSPFQRVVDRVRLEYYRYEVTFGLYVMTPTEKCVANTFVLVVFSLLLWALLLYFPILLFHKLTRAVWLVTGHSDEANATLRMIDMHGDPISTTSATEAILPSWSL
ncbi:hypothetical protein N7481_008122 [Penicillium waksmanii]|uniref:uncharacterized protein n=1 Tax=Penicillium waksmanii TaxID=69791 RepID=UPI0025470474|nr:uncharacterized protein N7481_008122 [Penicillium waksmanii]KAJ5980824.1 hypothetical protein N7481_008122 [Penicillium waksmanii]